MFYILSDNCEYEIDETGLPPVITLNSHLGCLFSLFIYFNLTVKLGSLEIHLWGFCEDCVEHLLLLVIWRWYLKLNFQLEFFSDLPASVNLCCNLRENRIFLTIPGVDISSFTQCYNAWQASFAVFPSVGVELCEWEWVQNVGCFLIHSYTEEWLSFTSYICAQEIFVFSTDCANVLALCV